jgi:hypothetical protein
LLESNVARFAQRYPQPSSDEKNKSRKKWHRPETMLVFDTETTIDATQRLLFGCSGVGIIKIRKSLSDALAAYLPFLPFRSADLPHLVTVRGLIPASREAWVRETLSVRIFEITERTRSQASLNFSGFARYWASVRGAAFFALARGLVEDPLARGADLLSGFLVSADDWRTACFALPDALLLGQPVLFVDGDWRSCFR